jgi:magnesium-transporting ATPase (P-type)
VGDGANDELMIREAHCGLGIGVEPTAETRAFSDRQVTRPHIFAAYSSLSYILSD